MINKKKYVGIALIGLTALLTACGSKEPAESTEKTEPAKQTEASEQAGDSKQEETTADTIEADATVFGDFETTDLEGNAVTQEVFSGYDLTMVNLWGTFCGPCIKEMPDLAAINTEYKDKGLQVVGVIIDVTDIEGNLYEDGVVGAKEIVEKTGANYIHLLPSADMIQAKLKDVSAVPETVFVDKEGNQVGESYFGARSGEKWKVIIESLLAEMK